VTVGAAGSTIQYNAVYVGGNFTNSGFASKYQLAAMQFQLGVDGADSTTAERGKTTFNAPYSNWTPFINPGPPVRALALSSDGNTLYAGGDFTTANPTGQTTPRNRVMAVAAIPSGAASNASCPTTGVNSCPATVNATWNPNPDGTQIKSLAVSGSGAGESVLIGGDFTTIGDVVPSSHNELAAVAGVASAFPGKTPGMALDWDPKLAGGPVNVLAVDTDNVFAGGAFNSAGATPRQNIAALDGNGALVSGWDAAPDKAVQAIATDGNKVYIGGDFTEVGAEDRFYLAALGASDGALDTNWHPAAHSQCTPTPPATNCTLPGSGGSCSITAPATSCEVPTNVMALALTPQAVYVGGAFTQIDKNGGPCPPVDPETSCGTARKRLAALNPAGAANPGQPIASWTPDAMSSTSSSSNVRAIDPVCGSVFIGGAFDRIGEPATAGGAQPTSQNLAAVRPVGALDDDGHEVGGTLSWGNAEADSAVFALAHARNGSVIYAGGNFSGIGVRDGTGQGHAVRSKLAALNTFDGTATGWNPSPDGTVRAIGVSADNQAVYAGGSFATMGGVARSRLAAVQADEVGDGTGDIITSWAPEPNGSVLALNVTPAAQGGDQLFAGGAFDEMATGAQSGFTSFKSPGATDGSSSLTCTAVAIGPPQIANPTVITSPTQALRFELSRPARVSIAVNRLVNGYRLRPDIDLEQLVCSAASKKGAYRSLEIELAKKLNKLEKAVRRRLKKRDAARARNATPVQRAALKRTFKRRALKETLAAQKAMIKKTAKKRRCTSVPLGAVSKGDGSTGTNTVSLAPLGGLPAGDYRATITAVDTRGRSTSLVFSFKL
jgi:hypothetical protein